MRISKKNKTDSYTESQPEFSHQEAMVLKLLDEGCSHAWAIAEHSSMLITSIRRALTMLERKKVIEQYDSVYWKETNRKVTAYRRTQPTLF